MCLNFLTLEVYAQQPESQNFLDKILRKPQFQLNLGFKNTDLVKTL